MATSGTYLWSPDLAECIDDAFERCKVDPSTLDVSHLLSARRSINFLLVEWAVEDYQEFRVDRLVVDLDDATYDAADGMDLDPDTDGRIIDILSMSLRRDDSDTPMVPMSREEWLNIPDKDTPGRPNRFFADKQRDLIKLYLWPTPENDTDDLIIDAMRKFQDAGGPANDPDIPYYMREAFTAGLAAKLGQKYAPVQVLQDLRNEAIRTFRSANGAQKERADVVITVGNGRRRRRR